MAIALLAVALPIATVVALRWIPPPASALMIENEVASWFRHEPHDIRYRWTGWRGISAQAGIAVVAAEDQKFPFHSGFDIEAIDEAIEDSRRGERLRGASTISQQVAKNLFLWPGRSFVRKGLEAYLTVLLETLWPKRRILEVYLNIAEFGPGIYGVGAASEVYFGERPSALGAREAALLAAVLPNPRRLHVDRPSPYVLRRVDWILGQMRHLGGPAYLDAH
ncbi:MAG: monofunctional biosynthetic peptidoglycan transglycosylase [Candidatus Eisenbacteria bacterium]